MRTRAAVAVAAGKPLEIMEVNLDGPKAGEVMVEIRATGICHSRPFLAMKAQAWWSRSGRVSPA